jgi:hypothetical protein
MKHRRPFRKNDAPRGRSYLYGSPKGKPIKDKSLGEGGTQAFVTGDYIVMRESVNPLLGMETGDEHERMRSESMDRGLFT